MIYRHFLILMHHQCTKNGGAYRIRTCAGHFCPDRLAIGSVTTPATLHTLRFFGEIKRERYFATGRYAVCVGIISSRTEIARESLALLSERLIDYNSCDTGKAVRVRDINPCFQASRPDAKQPLAFMAGWQRNNQYAALFSWKHS